MTVAPICRQVYNQGSAGAQTAPEEPVGRAGKRPNERGSGRLSLGLPSAHAITIENGEQNGCPAPTDGHALALLTTGAPRDRPCCCRQ